MPHLRTSIFQRKDPSLSDRSGDLPSAGKRSGILRAFSHRLRTILKLLSQPRQKSQKSPSTRNGLVQTKSQELSNPVVNSNMPNTGQSISSKVQNGHGKTQCLKLNGRRTSTTPYRQPIGGRGHDELNNLSEAKAPPYTIPSSSVKIHHDKRQIFWSDTKRPGTDQHDEASSSAVPNQNPADAINGIGERERTLRILESGGRSVTSRPCSPATIRRRRRSYQLATDPRIDPQQFSEFQHFLEQEIATDLALRLQVWRSLTQDLGSWAVSAINPDSTAKAPVLGCTTGGQMQGASRSSHLKPRRLDSSPRSMCSERYSIINPIAGRQDDKWDRQSLPIKSASAGSYPESRRASTSSFTHFVAQYIKPEIPITAHKKARNKQEREASRQS